MIAKILLRPHMCGLRRIIFLQKNKKPRDVKEAQKAPQALPKNQKQLIVEKIPPKSQKPQIFEKKQKLQFEDPKPTTQKRQTVTSQITGIEALPKKQKQTVQNH